MEKVDEEEEEEEKEEKEEEEEEWRNRGMEGKRRKMIFVTVF